MNDWHFEPDSNGQTRIFFGYMEFGKRKITVTPEIEKVMEEFSQILTEG